MNTYRLESRNPFNSSAVYNILKDIITLECRGLVYDPNRCAALVTTLSAKIRNKIKSLQFERYRLVVFVEIGEKKLQGLQLVAKCLWDASKDNFATFTFQNTSLFVSATCFGIYQD
ncbi:UNVERIFIED_CONTAM: hypothetical protein PYX00_000591 [Menopon gallinae]|uniref:Uncharacterized protein n=1 Tax=Menopon gallinae TaxID=328185 RepID=A0AAW2IB65_9NEOP